MTPMILDIDFATGQEPQSGDDYVSLMQVEFSLGEEDLAKISGRQRRVLSRVLDTVTSRQLINAVLRSNDLLALPQKPVGRFVRQYLTYETDEPYIARVIVDRTGTEESNLP